MTSVACRWLMLIVTSTIVLFTWTVILPWIGGCQALRTRIDLLNERQIDPAASYYTDLDVMTELEANIAALRKAHPEAFWPLP